MNTMHSECRSQAFAPHLLEWVRETKQPQYSPLQGDGLLD